MAALTRQPSECCVLLTLTSIDCLSSMMKWWTGNCQIREWNWAVDAATAGRNGESPPWQYRSGNLQLTIDYLENDGWRFQDIAGNFLGVQWLPSTYIAWRAEGEEATTLTLAAELNDIADSWSWLECRRSLRLAVGVLTQLVLAGSPQDFQLTAVSGTLDLEMQSGSFLSANSRQQAFCGCSAC